MRGILFEDEAMQKHNEWALTDRKRFIKLADLIKECQRDPFRGTGKPEPMKGDYAGCWSRRITEKDRLVYKVFETHILILRCNGHYE
jgi:toxin YoeB